MIVCVLEGYNYSCGYRGLIIDKLNYLVQKLKYQIKFRWFIFSILRLYCLELDCLKVGSCLYSKYLIEAFFLNQ